MIAALEETHACEVREALSGRCTACKQIPNARLPLRAARPCARCHSMVCGYCRYADPTTEAGEQCGSCMAKEAKR